MFKWLRPSGPMLGCFALLAVTCHVDRVHAQPADIAEPAVVDRPVAAHLIRVALPLVGSADDRVQRILSRLVNELEAAEDERPTVILEFSRGAGSETPSNFDRAFSLARFLAGDGLSSVRTVAYVPQTLSGHDVLPVIACEEIVIAGDSQFGAAGEQESDVGPAIKAAYEEIAAKRRTVPPAVAVAMLVPDVALMRAETADGMRLVLEQELAPLQKETTVKSVETLSAAGEMARFTGRQMRLELGLASHLAGDYAELSAALEMPIEYVNSSRLLGSESRNLRLDFSGVPTHQSVNRIIRMIAEGVSRQKVNQIVIWIDSSGGEPVESMRLAQYLIALDSEQVHTIAYVPELAQADAAMVALACDQLVLGEEARLGGGGSRDLSRGERESLRGPIKRLAADRGMGWSLAAGLVDPELEVAIYKRTDAPARQVFTEEEFAEQPEGIWELSGPIDLSGGLTAARAVDLGVANETASSDQEFLFLQGLPEDLEAAEPRWSDTLIDALARDEIAYILLFIAFSMLLAEISVPGIGVPGFVSAVCFAMYFWSRHLHGTAEWLEVILFVLGAVFILVEVFVIPGIGIFGIGGGLLMLAAVVLASQTFVVPTNYYQLEQLPNSLVTLLTCMAGMAVGLFALRHLLPRTPGLNKVILPPPEGDELEQIRVRETVVDWSRFLGQVGTATSTLVPAGKARFGRETIDVLSRGDLIRAGEKVRVIEAVGNRVIVVPVEE